MNPLLQQPCTGRCSVLGYAMGSRQPGYDRRRGGGKRSLITVENSNFWRSYCSREMRNNSTQVRGNQ